MTRSDAAIWFVSRAPRTGSLAVRLWAQSYIWRPRRIHWLFTRLKTMADVRVKHRARLVTGQSILVDPFECVGSSIAQTGCFDHLTVVLWRALLFTGAVVVDVGAHVGQFTLIASEAVGPRGSVLAFEPDPRTFAYLDENVRRNGCRNVVCSRSALAQEAADSFLYLSDVSNVGCNSLRKTLRHSGGSIPVQTQRLDDYVVAAGIERIDLLKVDVEGAELDVLRGAESLLARHRPAIVLELSINSDGFGYSSGDVELALADMHYTLYRVEAMPLRRFVRQANDLASFDVLAVHRAQEPELRARGVIA
jgi:FkbM family methyltransferase